MKSVLSILVNKTFINLIIKIITKSEFKAKIVFFFNDGTFSLMYNRKITTLNQFFSPEFFYIDNF